MLAPRAFLILYCFYYYVVCRVVLHKMLRCVAVSQNITIIVLFWRKNLIKNSQKKIHLFTRAFSFGMEQVHTLTLSAWRAIYIYIIIHIFGCVAASRCC